MHALEEVLLALRPGFDQSKQVRHDPALCASYHTALSLACPSMSQEAGRQRGYAVWGGCESVGMNWSSSKQNPKSSCFHEISPRRVEGPFEVEGQAEGSLENKNHKKEIAHAIQRGRLS